MRISKYLSRSISCYTCLLSHLEGLSAVAARPEVVGGPPWGNGDPETKAQRAGHDKTAAAGVAAGGEDLDPRGGHIGEQEGRHAAEDAIGDRREECRNLQ